MHVWRHMLLTLWFVVGQPSCCRRVSAGDQPTSVSLPVCRGHFLKCSQSSGVVWSHGQRVCSFRTWMLLRASHLTNPVRNGSCSLRSWMGRFLEVGWNVCWAQCRVVEGDLQFLLELLDLCPAVCVVEHAGEMLDGVGPMVCTVVGGIGGVLWYPVRVLMGLRFWGVCFGGVCGFGRGRGSGGFARALCSGVLPGCRPYGFRIGACRIFVSGYRFGRRGEGCEGRSRAAVPGCRGSSRWLSGAVVLLCGGQNRATRNAWIYSNQAIF